MTEPIVPRILCVEDDKDSREVITALLSEVGCEVATAATPTEGLELARGGGFAVIVLDNWYDKGSGVELCRQIRSFDADSPIIFYSGAAEHADIQSGLAVGAQAYIIKPYIEELVSTVSRLIQKDGGPVRDFGREDRLTCHILDKVQQEK
jgi:CheY-like chemotaxis protein